MRVVACRATETAIRLIKTTAEDQPLAWEPNGIRGLLDRPDRLEIGILWRRPMAYPAHLRLRESIQTAGMEDFLVHRGPSLHGLHMLRTWPMAPLATNAHIVPGGRRLINRCPGGMASQTLNSFAFSKRSSQALRNRLRRELRRARREIEPVRGRIPTHAALSKETVIQATHGRNSLSSAPEGPFKRQAIFGRTGSGDQDNAVVQSAAQR
jgi:hypothetical protein